MDARNGWATDAVLNAGGHLGAAHDPTLAIGVFCRRCLHTCAAWEPPVPGRAIEAKVLAGCCEHHGGHLPDRSLVTPLTSWLREFHVANTLVCEPQTNGIMKPLNLIADAARVIVHEGRALLRVDLTSAIVVLVFLGFFLPSIARHAGNAEMLAAFVDDEPFITMQVDGMTARPYGNPANYLDKKHDVPSHWGNLRYDGLIYYGGLYLDVGLAIWAPLKLAGLPIFPTLPVVLRAITVLFTVATLLAIYNVGRMYMGRMAALVGLLYMATNYYLVSIGTVVHPDSLLFFLTFLALVLCVRHARDGALESLLAIGIVAGLAQAAKMGAPPLIPIVVLSVVMGIKLHVPVNVNRGAWFIREVLQKGFMVALVAVVVFMVFTPFAVLDPYFINAWKAASQIFIGGSAASQTDFLGWFAGLFDEVGSVLLAACGLALVGRYVHRDRYSENLPILFYAILASSIFVYFATLQKIWVQRQYLIVVFAFMATVAGHALDQLSERMVPLFSRRPVGVATLSLTVAVMYLFLMSPRLLAVAILQTQQANWRHEPQMQVGAWLRENQPQESGAVLVDNQAYFDPRAFPSQIHNGGPITYEKLARALPDYFVLTVYENNWMAEKMGGQQYDKWDNRYDSMRLYQDLLGFDPGDITVRKDIPGIKFIAAFGGRESTTEWLDPASISRWDLILRFNEILASRGGRRIFLFRLDSDKFVESIPDSKKQLSAKAFASSTAPGGYDVNNVMVDNQLVWVSAKNGKDAIGEYIGIDYGRFNPVAPAGLVVKWIGYNWRPGALDIQFSDNGKEWQSKRFIPLAIPLDPPISRVNGTERWEECFSLPANGKHRYWRIVARDVPEANMFGVERLRFDFNCP